MTRSQLRNSRALLSTKVHAHTHACTHACTRTFAEAGLGSVCCALIFAFLRRPLGPLQVWLLGRAHRGHLTAGPPILQILPGAISVGGGGPGFWSQRRETTLRSERGPGVRSWCPNTSFVILSTFPALPVTPSCHLSNANYVLELSR